MSSTASRYLESFRKIILLFLISLDFFAEFVQQKWGMQIEPEHLTNKNQGKKIQSIKSQIIFLLSSGAFQPEHVQPYLGGLRGSGRAGKTKLSQGYDQRTAQKRHKWDQSLSRRSQLSKRTESGRPERNRWPIARITRWITDLQQQLIFFKDRMKYLNNNVWHWFWSFFKDSKTLKNDRPL